MSKLIEEFLKDSVTVTANNDELFEISRLAQEQQDWEKRIKAMEYDLDQAKEAMRQIQEFLLPEAMMTIGMSEFKLSNGDKITIKDDIYASIKKDNLMGAMEWLDSNNLGGVIKDKIELSFGRGEIASAEEVMSFCRQKGYNASEVKSVHPMTLKALVKEQMAVGLAFPEEFFSISPARKAIIKGK